MALPADAAADISKQAKCETSMATANIHVPSNLKAADVGKTCDIVRCATAPDAPGDKYADSAPTSCKVESMRAQETAPAEAMVGSWPSKDLGTASALPLPPVTSCQPCSLPGSLPFPKFAASASAKPYVDPETLNVLDAKNVETSAQTKASPAVQDSGVKPDASTTGLTLQRSRHSHAAGWGSAIAKGGDGDPERLMKPTLYPDHIREASTAPAMSASGLGVPADETCGVTLSSAHNPVDDDEWDWF